jgi:preprotein translocase subunit SecB
MVKIVEAAVSNLRTSIQIAKSEDNPRAWRVILNISVGPPEPGAFCPYLIDIELLGFFEVHEDFPEDQMQDLISCNATAVLYSAAREFLILVTGRGPLPAYLLPSTHFADQSEANRAKTEGTVPACK